MTRPQITPATIPPMGAEEVDVEVALAEALAEDAIDDAFV